MVSRIDRSQPARVATNPRLFARTFPGRAKRTFDDKGLKLPIRFADRQPAWPESTSPRLAAPATVPRRQPQATTGTRGTNVSTDSELETAPGLPEACVGTGSLELQKVSETARFRPTPSPKSSYSNQPGNKRLTRCPSQRCALRRAARGLCCGAGQAAGGRLWLSL